MPPSHCVSPNLKATVSTVIQTVKAMVTRCTILFTDELRLITMGYTVASFLDNEDASTKDMYLLPLKDVRTKGYQVGSRV
jgi:hypothetical protein